MKRYIIIMSFLIAWATSLTAANITRAQADEIVQNYVQCGTLYSNVNEPSAEGIVITTSNEETFKAKYACWAYCLDESDPVQRRYLFVKEDNGSLLEIIASNDVSELDASWTVVITGFAVETRHATSLLYPNPVGDLLTIPCNENVRIEIYDLKGTRFFSGLLTGGDTCQLNVSFLNAGVYMLSVGGKMYKIIKN